MKVMKCESCGRTQSQGSFCLDCGNKLVTIVTSNVTFKPMKTSRSSDALKRDVRNWLNRIGVQNSDIVITHDGNSADLTYILDGKEYAFKSVMQTIYTNNLAAVEQFLHSRVLGIERGIETAEQAFKGYEALPAPDHKKSPWEVLGFEEPVSLLRAVVKFKDRIKEVHPDVNDSPMAAVQFDELHKAIEEIKSTLSTRG